MENQSIFKQVYAYAKQYKTSFFNLFTSTIIANILTMTFPFLLSMMVDEVFLHSNKAFYLNAIGFYVVIYLIQAIMLFIQTVTFAYLSNRFLFDVRLKLFKKIEALPILKRQTYVTGDLMTRINRDTDEIMDFIHVNYFNIAILYVQIITCLIFVMMIDMQITLLLALLLPCAVYFAVHCGKKVEMRASEYRKKYGEHIGWLYEVLNGLKEIRLLNSTAPIDSRFTKDTVDLTRIKIKLAFNELTAERLNTGVCLMCMLIIYIVGSLKVKKGTMTLGEITAIIWYFNLLKTSLVVLSQRMIGAKKNEVALQKVFEFLKEEEEEIKHEKLVVTKGEITFEAVDFEYMPHQPLLKQFNLKIKAGETIALVGASGSGKTTLMYLLLGFYPVTKGKVCIDGIDISKINTTSLREQIGMVQQECILFNETLRYNLLLAKPKATQAELLQACKEAQLETLLQKLPNGLDTKLGGENIAISGGEQQRVAIARLFLRNPSIVILDEATSHLDGETEREIQNAYARLCKGRTTIIIAHRLSAIHGVDCIAVLDQGKLVGYGMHETLLSECRLYRDLYQYQYDKEGEEALDEII